MKLEVGKTYNIHHKRKGKWTAKVISIDPVLDKDRFVTFSDVPDEPCRVSLILSAEEV